MRMRKGRVPAPSGRCCGGRTDSDGFYAVKWTVEETRGREPNAVRQYLGSETALEFENDCWYASKTYVAYVANPDGDGNFVVVAANQECSFIRGRANCRAAGAACVDGFRPPPTSPGGLHKRARWRPIRGLYVVSLINQSCFVSVRFHVRS